MFQSHLAELRRTDLMSDENYYTVEQVQQIYGLTSANICHIVKVKHIGKVKVGRKNLLLQLPRVSLFCLLRGDE